MRRSARMSQKRHEKVLRRKSRMGSRGKERREARRMRRHGRRSAAFEAVFGPQSLGPGLEGQISTRLDPGELARMVRIQERFRGAAWKDPERTRKGREGVVLDADIVAVHGSLAAKAVETSSDGAVRDKERLDRLYGKAGAG
jgi:hypothetical protein